MAYQDEGVKKAEKESREPKVRAGGTPPTPPPSTLARALDAEEVEVVVETGGAGRPLVTLGAAYCREEMPADSL